MKNDVFKIIVLGIILITMIFGLVFLVKSDILSSKEDTKVTDKNEEKDLKDEEQSQEKKYRKIW